MPCFLVRTDNSFRYSKIQRFCFKGIYADGRGHNFCSYKVKIAIYGVPISELSKSR